MKSPLHILHLEDNSDDAALVVATLEAADIRCTTTRVQNREAFVAALEGGGFDLILSDYTLPGFDGLAATELAHARWPAIPMIFVSGTLGEERAIDSLKNGATDYVLKERLGRLVPAVRRAMREVEEQAERRRLEAQLIEAQKMEVLGQLAGGVAHDFNNILGVILGYDGLLATGLGVDNPLQNHVKEIRHAAERAVGLTRQLLIFSRKQIVELVVLDLNDVMAELDKMLRRLIDENIVMTLVPGKPLGRVEADTGHLGQLLMNLVVNARDAMPKGGGLTIATSNVTLDENDARARQDVAAGDYVMLAVTDTGTGMTPEVKERLFEPFFTTKPKGKGTGLGLSTCRTIVKQFGGHIVVVSEPGQGTTFRLYFPRVEQPLTAAAKPDEAGPAPGGTETLLVVEDEPAVRHLARGVLEQQGYAVLSASNGQEALHVAREHKGPPIRLVVTDVVMPLMGGKVMAEWLQTTLPDLKILFTSGYMDDAIAQQGLPDDGVEFLAKPYTPSALAWKVRTLLNEGAVPPDEAEKSSVAVLAGATP